MKKYLYYCPHVITLVGLGFAALAALAIFDGRYSAAARYLLLVLAVDRIDGTLARKLKVKDKFPGTSGEVLDIITDLVGLTFVPMLLFARTGLFIDGTAPILVAAASMAASWKYSRKEGFLEKGYSVGAPPVFFSLFLFYFLRLPAIFPTVYAVILILLVVSPVRYPITSLVTTHWKPGYKSITNYLTAIFFIPVFILLHDAPQIIYWLMLTMIAVQLFIYPLLLRAGVIKPVFDREY
ncbi:MAG: CDP-alcohol phosphatidyltransferase family protein [Candidatus Zixiibacteriota bacterium]|nr:MAG: CDP-alcohol phosphatidyltransferase family protein [candidate division Zixibacteria bacterium]